MLSSLMLAAALGSTALSPAAPATTLTPDQVQAMRSFLENGFVDYEGSRFRGPAFAAKVDGGALCFQMNPKNQQGGFSGWRWVELEWGTDHQALSMFADGDAGQNLCSVGPADSHDYAGEIFPKGRDAAR